MVRVIAVRGHPDGPAPHPLVLEWQLSEVVGLPQLAELLHLDDRQIAAARRSPRPSRERAAAGC